jgi:ribosomal protein L31
MPKSDIHPTWFSKTPVFCEGKTLCYTSSTKDQLQLDVG